MPADSAVNSQTKSRRGIYRGGFSHLPALK
jgi:hypothetical protein